MRVVSVRLSFYGFGFAFFFCVCVNVRGGNYTHTHVHAYTRTLRDLFNERRIHWRCFERVAQKLTRLYYYYHQNEFDD